MCLSHPATRLKIPSKQKRVCYIRNHSRTPISSSSFFFFFFFLNTRQPRRCFRGKNKSLFWRCGSSAFIRKNRPLVNKSFIRRVLYRVAHKPLHKNMCLVSGDIWVNLYELHEAVWILTVQSYLISSSASYKLSYVMYYVLEEYWFL